MNQGMTRLYIRSSLLAGRAKRSKESDVVDKEGTMRRPDLRGLFDADDISTLWPKEIGESFA